MSGAGQILAETVIAALRALEGLNNVYDGPPLTAAFPYAIVEAGPESDWSHKSGAGRELRLSILVRDKGERPARLRALVAGIEDSIIEIGSELTGWRLVNLVFVREAMLRETSAAWSAAIDYRARLLKT
jgi:hypothetical protein